MDTTFLKSAKLELSPPDQEGAVHVQLTKGGAMCNGYPIRVTMIRSQEPLHVTDTEPVANCHRPDTCYTEFAPRMVRLDEIRIQDGNVIAAPLWSYQPATGFFSRMARGQSQESGLTLNRLFWLSRRNIHQHGNDMLATYS